MAVRALNGLVGCFAFEKLTVSNTAKVLTATVYRTQDAGVQGTSANTLFKTAQFATITVEVDQIRYRTDGTAPTSTTGHLLNVGDVLYLSSTSDIQNFQGIRVNTDATIQVSYA